MEALEEALTRYGVPEIFNTDQGSQFTVEGFTGPLLAKGVRVSMDRYFDFYNVSRPHQSLDYRTPDEMYFGGIWVAAGAEMTN